MIIKIIKSGETPADDGTLQEIRELTEECNLADGTHYGTPDDADIYYLMYDSGNLAGFIAAYAMGETYKGKDLLELASAVRPQMRRQGVFRQLFNRLSQDAARHGAAINNGERQHIYPSSSCVNGEKGQGNKKEAAFRFAVYQNESTAAVLERLGAVFQKDELMMEAAVSGYAAHAPTEALTDKMRPELDFDAGTLRHKFGECCFKMLYGDINPKCYIYGVRTYSSFTGRGYASAMLGLLFRELAGREISTAMLEVSSDNAPAVALYDKLGFTVTDRLGIYIVVE